MKRIKRIMVEGGQTVIGDQDAVLKAVTELDLKLHKEHPDYEGHIREWVAGEWDALVAIQQPGFCDGRVNQHDHMVSVIFNGPHPMRGAIRRSGPLAGKAVVGVIW